MKHTSGITIVVATVAGLLLALTASTAAEAARAPIGRTYFVVSMGGATDASETYEEAARCISFTRTEVCSAMGCGTWRRLDAPGKGERQDSIEFELVLIDDETEQALEVVGRADLDRRGRKSAMGGAALGRQPGTGRVVNIALGGRAVGAASCPRLVEDFERED